jgi:hypothetical protein
LKVWPNFFIVGAPKSGTTSLHDYLNQHPKIFLPSIKEIHFFDISDTRKNEKIQKIREGENYNSLFQPQKGETAIGESTSSYLADPLSPNLIHKTVPNAKIIISLRDPADRVYSHYLHRMNLDDSFETFTNFIKKHEKNLEKKLFSNNILYQSMYFDQVTNYLNEFGKDNVKILIFEEWIKKIPETIHKLETFLGVEKFTEYQFSVENQYKGKKTIVRKLYNAKISKTIFKSFISSDSEKKLKDMYIKKFVKKPKVLENDRKFLEELFSSDIKKLEKLLDRPLPWYNNR